MDLNLPKEAVESFEELFDKIYKGDKHAAWLSLAILHILHTWDDLIDRDVPISDNSINSAFLVAMTDVSVSPLWDIEMVNLMRLVYFKWQAANKFENDAEATDNTLAKAWMLRASCYDFFVAIANKLYGATWAEKISPIVYSFYGEELKTFIKETRNA